MLEFEKDNSKAGFRLHRLEVLNWGTFHQKIWTISPGGSTSLLTGANGSGKSTLVDALLTLLIPNGRRNYNLASGSGKKERDEMTYVRGAFSTVKHEDEYKSKPEYLRTKEDYSVLLAYFYNEGLKLKVTLAQVLYIKDSRVEKFFVVAGDELTIDQKFNNFKIIPQLKKQLQSTDRIEVFEQFSDYSKRFRKIFGLESEKALDLFNQTVSIKEIGKLNDFVRAHMLEKTDVQDKINQLKQHYEDLTSSHDAMVKAKKQLEMLESLSEEASKWQKVEDEIADLERCAAVVPAYFAQHKIGLLEKAIAEKQQQLNQEQHDLSKLIQLLDNLRQREKDLDFAIKNDDKGRKIRELEQRIILLDTQISNTKKRTEKYNDLARELGFPSYSDRDTFYASALTGRDARKDVADKLQELIRERDDKISEINTLKAECQKLEQELQSLKQRKSQIPSVNLQLRTRILTDLGIDEGEIPFIGELLKVKDEERNWEGVIERLLHDFGVGLLVPERHYQKFSQYVSQKNLGARIVFYSVNHQPLYNQTRMLDNDSVVNKLDVKPNTDFFNWIKEQLIEEFDFICCENDRFYRESYAITKTGLIKTGNSLHIKDDRHKINNRSQYILGWNNIDKIEAIEAELKQLKAQLHKSLTTKQDIDKEEEKCRKQEKLLEELLNFQDFSDIDWQRDANSRQNLADQKQQLEESADSLKHLKKQHENVKLQIEDVTQEQNSVAKIANNIERDIQDYQKQRDNCQLCLNPFLSAELPLWSSKIETRLKNTTLTIKNVDSLKEDLMKVYRESIEKAKTRWHNLESRISGHMKDYKREYPNETADVDASLAAIGDFNQMLERIKIEDLPSHEKRFKELLTRKAIDAISVFNGTLYDWEYSIKVNIENLNQSLKTIDYTPLSYIQVESEPTRDSEIKDFRNKLTACFYDVAQQTPEANEVRFENIKNLINCFKEQDRWTTKVTDVRNWLNFSVREKNKLDDSEKNYFADSGGKSGGQKAKLAYTILASAIAYQFGLVQGETTSFFRFVVVDEAFSKADVANAKYAMELFKQLNLQLLVVTPLDKIHVVEPYVGAVHFVENNAEEKDSKVYNLSIEQYRQNKAN